MALIPWKNIQEGRWNAEKGRPMEKKSWERERLEGKVKGQILTHKCDQTLEPLSIDWYSLYMS